MPSRIVKFLDEMDVLREQVSVDIDAQLKRVNLKPLIANPENAAAAFKEIIADFLFSKKTKSLLAQARLEGIKLSDSL